MYIIGLVYLLFYFLVFLIHAMSCIFLQSNLASSQPPLIQLSLPSLVSPLS
jgi:hypothetical protein